MDSGLAVWGFVFIVTAIFSAAVVAHLLSSRNIRLGRLERRELASARAAMVLIEKDATEYRTDLLSDLILAHVEKYKYRELE